jgi:adenine-specific DNA-methyltransferase
MKQRARELRRSQTEAERNFWNRVRDRRLSGYKFRRQHPIGPFVVDFVCLDRRLIIELDGGQHALDVEEDRKRSLFLESQGYTILRLWNNEVFENMEGVLQTVLSVLNEVTPSPRPSPPKSGERGKTTTLGRQSGERGENDGPGKAKGGEGEDKAR